MKLSVAKLLSNHETTVTKSIKEELQRITTHIFLNIWQIKGNQKMKFGELIEHAERNIFL